MYEDETQIKIIDTLYSSTVIHTTSAANVVGPLNACIQGSDYTNRVGRKINMETLQLYWTGSLVATSAGGSPLRMIIVYDNQTSGSAPSVTDLMMTDNIYSNYNLNFRDRFIILEDDWIPSVGTSGPQGWYQEYHLDLKGLPTWYNGGNTGTITDINTGAIYAFFWQNGQITTASPTNAANFRIIFNDN